MSVFRKTVFIFQLIFFFFGSLVADGDHPKEISVIIPCHYKHFHLLPNLLDLLSTQSLLPDEVVVSLSEAYFVPKEDIDTLTSTVYPFSFSLIATNKVKYAGENRNIAAENSTGKIIVTQDADDLPHHQRLEIIKYLMHKTGASELIHQWTYEEGISHNPVPKPPKWIEHIENFDAITVFKVNSIKHLNKTSYIHNGNIGVLRSVLDSVDWPSDKKGQDVKFNKLVMSAFKNTYLAVVPLVIYRNDLSSHRNFGDEE